MKAPSKIQVKVQIKNGKFVSNKNRIADILNSYEGMTIDVIFKKRSNSRSVLQNRYYWGVIVPIWMNLFREEWGELFDKDYVHEILKAKCNYVDKVVEETGEVVRIPASTKQNTTVSQEEFHERCRRLAKDMFDAEIPLPNEELRIDFK